MSKTANVLNVLSLFSDTRQHLGATDIAALLGVSNATAYRYINELENSGFIESAGRGAYVLGPAVVRLDRLIRMNDPLIQAARSIMRELVDRTGGTALLARYFGGTVMCVHDIEGRNGPHTVSYERGRAMPLYLGSPSTVILAHLGREALRDIVRRDAGEIRKAGLPAEGDQLHADLASIRQKGIAHTQGAVDRDVMGWSAAITHGSHVLGSLSVLLDRNTPDISPPRIEDQLRRAALRVQGRL